MSGSVLLTGVTGFAGSYVARFLLKDGFKVVGAARREPEIDGLEFFKIADLNAKVEWGTALAKVDCVVHMAGRAHQMNDGPEQEYLYYKTNVDATLELAKQAIKAGVNKFIFISTVKVFGEGSDNAVFTEESSCNPRDAYGKSKLQAELELGKICEKGEMQLIIMRPPLMYGPDVKGNMASLVKLVKRMPLLPFGGINNRRSLLGINNFASAIKAVLDSDKTSSGIYLLTDGEAISTTTLVDRMIQVFHPKCRNFAFPAFFWAFGKKIPFLQSKFARLCGSFELDSSAFRRKFNWNPPMSMLEQFQEMRSIDSLNK